MGNFIFERRHAYWSVYPQEGHVIPSKMVNEIANHSLAKFGIDADGMSGGGPGIKGATVDYYHVHTPVGLKLIADIIKAGYVKS